MLEPGRLVVAYDLRGHGRSPWSGAQTIEQHGDDLDEVLDDCGIDQAGLIGEGFGARVAIEFAVRQQERINSLTLLEPPLAPVPAEMYARARRSAPAAGYASVDDAIEQRRDEDGLLHTPRVPAGGGDGRAPGRRRGRPLPLPLQPRGGGRGVRGGGLAGDPVRGGAVPDDGSCAHATSSWLSERDVDVAFEQIRRLRVDEVPGGRAVLWDSLAETSALVRDFLVAKRKTA